MTTDERYWLLASISDDKQVVWSAYVDHVTKSGMPVHADLIAQFLLSLCSKLTVMQTELLTLCH